MGVPTDQISRIEDYVLSAPAVPEYVPPPAPVQAPVQSVIQPPAQAPAIAPGVAPGPGAAQSTNPTAGRAAFGIPANMPPAAPMVPGPGVGGRPLDAQGRGIAGLRPLDVSGGTAVQAPGPQRQAAQPNAGPAMGGPAGSFRGSAAGRPNFNPAGRKFNGRGAGMMGRGRQPELNRYMAQPPGAQVQTQPAAQGQQPAPGQQPAHPQDPPPNPPQSTEEDPPTATEPEVEAQPPAAPEDEKTEPEASQPTEGETPDDSTGGAS